MAETKPSLDTTEDDLLLGDGFSIVDSAIDTNDQPKPIDEDEPKADEAPAPIKADPPKKEEPKKDEPKKKEAPVEELNGVNSDVKSEALLLTTEEDLDLDKDKKSESEPKDDAKPAKDEPDKRKQTGLWISNITRHTKATDLKKTFARHGKVITAKVVTNGRSNFGYIIMADADTTTKCLRSLNGSSLDGRKISVSRQRPSTTTSIKQKERAKKSEEKEKAKAEEKPKAEKKAKDEDKLDLDKELAKKDELLGQSRRIQDRLRRETEFLRRESTRLKRNLIEEKNRWYLEQQKTRALGRELSEAEGKLREERRKFDREREVYEKGQRTDRVKLESDRTAIKKELEEVKKLREYLKRKIEEETADRRPRNASPFAYSSKRFREAGSEKKYVEERTRTPPSPPKLTSAASRSKRSPALQEKEGRRGHHGSGGHYGVVGTKVQAPEAPRNIWTSSFHQEVWRMPPSGQGFGGSGSSSGQQYGRQEYSSSKGQGYSNQRDFSKREHYSGSSSLRKY